MLYARGRGDYLSTIYPTHGELGSPDKSRDASGFGREMWHRDCTARGYILAKFHQKGDGGLLGSMESTVERMGFMEEDKMSDYVGGVQ